MPTNSPPPPPTIQPPPHSRIFFLDTGKLDLYYTQIHLHRGGCFFALISIFTVFGRFFFTYSLTLYDGAILFSDD